MKRSDMCKVPSATLKECRADLVATMTLQTYWRRAAGSLSCLFDGVGPTGGFCVQEWYRNMARKSRTSRSVEPSQNSCVNPAFAAALGTLFANQSVVDLGCGLGAYGRFFAENAPSVQWLGLDGSEEVDLATNGTVRFVDLSEGWPPDLARRGPWDWAMSIEVAEHVPVRGEATFMHNLIAHARAGLVLSWAPPLRHGHHHVNCQPERYVTCVLEQLGWSADVRTRDALRDTIHGHKLGTVLSRRLCSWLKDTIMVFRRSGGAAASGALDPDVVRTMPRTEWNRRYEETIARKCVRSTAGCGANI